MSSNVENIKRQVMEKKSKLLADSKKLLEQEEEDDSGTPIKKRISRLVYRISSMLPVDDPKKQANINSALLILNHATMIADDDSSQASRLLNRARTIARK